MAPVDVVNRVGGQSGRMLACPLKLHGPVHLREDRLNRAARSIWIPGRKGLCECGKSLGGISCEVAAQQQQQQEATLIT
jgi:hypothetical protein